MSARPTAYFRALAPMIAPIPARPGQYIALWLNCPERTLTVIDAGRGITLRSAAVELRLVSAELLHLCVSGTIEGLTPVDVSLLQQRAS